MRSYIPMAILEMFLFSSSHCLAQCNFYPDELTNQPSDHGGGMQPIDLSKREALPYEHVREADIFWSKRIWREIDLSEKMNKFFKYEAPVNGNDYYFINVLKCIVDNNEDVQAYSTADDQFTKALTKDEFDALFYRMDTVQVYVDTLDDYVNEPMTTQLNPDDVIRYRVKEDWFFDKETSTMQVRIIGIAPIVNVYDENGNLLFSKPMFWVYYPDLRKYLAKYWAFNYLDDAQPMSWDDVFEMRYFSSFITKESNVYDRRIQDYATSNLDGVLEAQRIKENIFDTEDDIWVH